MSADFADDMCPNCLTPWKCNGPHLDADPTPAVTPDSGALDRVRRYCEATERHEPDSMVAYDWRTKAIVSLGDIRELLHMASEGIR